MIKNKYLLGISVVILLVAMSLNIPFPHKDPYGEMIFSAMHIPIRFANGFHTLGIIVLALLILGLYLLAKSLEEYEGRIIFIAILIVMFTPVLLVNLYQKTLATGINAISYEHEASLCDFEMMNDQQLHGECELSFQNHHSEDVQFTLEFYEELFGEDDLPVVSLMNEGGPYEVTLDGKEHKRVHFETMIDVSKMKDHIDGGNATWVDIKISADGKTRDL